MSLIQYAGRTIDLAAYQQVPTQGEALLTAALTLDGGAGSVVTGVAKLSQRFLLELLTEKGSIAYSTRGTTFMIDARLSRWRTSADVEQSFFAAMVDVKRNLINEELLTDPTDERFGAANLLNVILNSDGVSLRLQVLSLAGTTRMFIAPIPLTV